MAKPKGYNPHFDLEVNPKKLKSCFNFQNDLKVGKAGEDYVENILEDNSTTLEIKRDSWVCRSKNLAIEFESRGKPSGIRTSQAEYWAINIADHMVLIMPSSFLREVCERYIKEDMGIKAVGDRGKDGLPTSKVVLIKWSDLLDLFNQYQNSR